MLGGVQSGMSSSSANPAVESLLEQAPYVRGLARELVFDPHLARDVEQETLLAALEHSPREASGLRGWLAAIVRNTAIKAWRSSTRREQRERALARTEAVVPSPSEILEREDQRRRLIERVLALDEPLRAVLVLRFFAELPPREVARRLGLPVETVRTRTKRGLELLRERLDRESRGGRAAWCLALVRGFELPASSLQLGTALVSSSLSGVAIMSLATRLALPVLALVAVATGAVLWNRSGLDERSPTLHEAGSDRLGARAVRSEAPRTLAPATSKGRQALTPTAASGRRAPAAPAQGSEEHLDGPGSLLLEMSWHDGTPAADVSAMVYSSAAEDFYADAFEVRTGADGTCRIDALPAGTVSVFGRADAVGDAVVVAGEEVELALTIPRGYDVDGIVVDAGGLPVGGAEIVADDSGNGWTGSVVACSGADGRFHVRSIADSLLFLSASAPGFAPSALYVFMSGAGATLDVQLTLPAPGGTLTGTVRDAAGQAIAHAQLLVGDERGLGHVTVPEGGQAWRPVARRVDADENGSFEIAGLAAGPQEVRVRARDFAPWTGVAEVSAGETTQLAITLLQEASVEGTVTDASGAPLAGIEVLSGRGGFLDRWTRSRADGSFFVRGLPAGEFELQVAGERRGSSRATLSGTPGALLRWDPMLDGGLSIRGRIVGAGIDPTACVVRCERFAEGGVQYWEEERPDEQGVFEFSGVSDAGHHLEVLAADVYLFPLAVLGNVHPAAGETVIEIDAARWPSVHLLGRVLDSGGEPLPGAMIMPSLEDSPGRNSPLLATDAAGTFDLGPYPPGRWTILVEAAQAGELRTATVELGPGETWDFGDLQLPD
jgi:RNA polymerase sigma-70 factor (ECF subfamily)